jgi:Flp pilus assembly protein TadG
MSGRISGAWAILRNRIVPRMRRDARKGSAAVEFAFVAPVFLLFLFGILEAGIISFGNAELQHATDDLARLVKTGQVQSASMSAATFRTTLCAEITPLFACDSNLQIDVESYSSFSSASFSNPIKSDGTLDPTLDNFSPGNAGDIVLVRVFYTWNILDPLLKPFFKNMSNGDRLISATVAFRNEPFS